MSQNQAKEFGNATRLADARLTKGVVRVSEMLAVAALSVLLLTIVVSVAARYVFAAPLLGSNEIVQLCLVAVVSLAMLPAVHGERHVRVDIMDPFIGKYGRYAGDILSRGIAAYVFISLAFRAKVQAFDAAEFGDATNMLSIPLWPFYALIVLGAALHGIMLLVQLVDLLRLGVSKNV